jgi:hypothetical protein
MPAGAPVLAGAGVVLDATKILQDVHIYAVKFLYKVVAYARYQTTKKSM